MDGKETRPVITSSSCTVGNIKQTSKSKPTRNNAGSVNMSSKVSISNGWSLEDSTSFAPPNVTIKQSSSSLLFAQRPSQSPAVIVPRGWNRILEKGCITYISPNKSRLRSLEDLKIYFMVDGTCKCGIECPFRVEDVFNFNPVIPSIPSRFDSNKDDKIGCRQCKINNKFNQLFPPVSQDFLSDIKAAMNRNKSKNEQQAPTSGASNSNNFGSSATSRKKTKDVTKVKRKPLSSPSRAEECQSSSLSDEQLHVELKRVEVRHHNSTSSSSCPNTVMNTTIPSNLSANLSALASTASVLPKVEPASTFHLPNWPRTQPSSLPSTSTSSLSYNVNSSSTRNVDNKQFNSVANVNQALTTTSDLVSRYSQVQGRTSTSSTSKYGNNLVLTSEPLNQLSKMTTNVMTNPPVVDTNVNLKSDILSQHDDQNPLSSFSVYSITDNNRRITTVIPKIKTSQKNSSGRGRTPRKSTLEKANKKEQKQSRKRKATVSPGIPDSGFTSPCVQTSVGSSTVSLAGQGLVFSESGTRLKPEFIKPNPPPPSDPLNRDRMGLSSPSASPLLNHSPQPPLSPALSPSLLALTPSPSHSSPEASQERRLEVASMSSSLNIRSTQAPPNVTLNPDFSNTLPKMLIQQTSKPVAVPSKSSSIVVPSPTNVSVSSPQGSLPAASPPMTGITPPIGMIKGRYKSKPDAKANVYWGSEIQQPVLPTTHANAPNTSAALNVSSSASPSRRISDEFKGQSSPSFAGTRLPSNDSLPPSPSPAQASVLSNTSQQTPITQQSSLIQQQQQNVALQPQNNTPRDPNRQQHVLKPQNQVAQSPDQLKDQRDQSRQHPVQVERPANQVKQPADQLQKMQAPPPSQQQQAIQHQNLVRLQQNLTVQQVNMDQQQILSQRQEYIQTSDDPLQQKQMPIHQGHPLQQQIRSQQVQNKVQQQIQMQQQHENALQQQRQLQQQQIRMQSVQLKQQQQQQSSPHSQAQINTQQQQQKQQQQEQHFKQQQQRLLQEQQQHQQLQQQQLLQQKQLVAQQQQQKTGQEPLSQQLKHHQDSRQMLEQADKQHTQQKQKSPKSPKSPKKQHHQPQQHNAGAANQATQMILFQFVQQGRNSASRSNVTATNKFPDQGTNRPRQPFPNPHPPNMPIQQTVFRNPRMPYPVVAAPTSGTQFFIMGTQASQALQSLAANAALSHETEQASAMYFQNPSRFPGHEMAAAGAQGIGLAYANIPFQFMTLAGPPVMGKHSQQASMSAEAQQHAMFQYLRGIRGIDPSQLVRGVDPSQLLRGIDPSQLVRGVDPSHLVRGVDPNQLVRGMDPSQLGPNRPAGYMYPPAAASSFIPGIPNNYVRIAPANGNVRLPSAPLPYRPPRSPAQGNPGHPFSVTHDLTTIVTKAESSNTASHPNSSVTKTSPDKSDSTSNREIHDSLQVSNMLPSGSSTTNISDAPSHSGQCVPTLEYDKKPSSDSENTEVTPKQTVVTGSLNTHSTSSSTPHSSSAQTAISDARLSVISSFSSQETKEMNSDVDLLNKYQALTSSLCKAPDSHPSKVTHADNKALTQSEPLRTEEAAPGHDKTPTPNPEIISKSSPSCTTSDVVYSAGHTKSIDSTLSQVRSPKQASEDIGSNEQSKVAEECSNINSPSAVHSDLNTVRQVISAPSAIDSQPDTVTQTIPTSITTHSESGTVTQAIPTSSTTDSESDTVTQTIPTSSRIHSESDTVTQAIPTSSTLHSESKIVTRAIPTSSTIHLESDTVTQVIATPNSIHSEPDAVTQTTPASSLIHSAPDTVIQTTPTPSTIHSELVTVTQDMAPKDCLSEVAAAAEAESIVEDELEENICQKQSDIVIDVKDVTAKILDDKSSDSCQTDDGEEMNLQCNEECGIVSEDSRAPTPDVITSAIETSNIPSSVPVISDVPNSLEAAPDISNSASDIPNSNSVTSDVPTVQIVGKSVKVSSDNNCEIKAVTKKLPALKVGDLVWGQLSGFTSWPGKVVSEDEVKQAQTDNGKVWVRWFGGDRSCTQIEIERLKALTDGLKELDGNSRRRKNRGGKRTTNNLEQAIYEALQEMETKESEENSHVSTNSDETRMRPKRRKHR